MAGVSATESVKINTMPRCEQIRDSRQKNVKRLEGQIAKAQNPQEKQQLEKELNVFKSFSKIGDCPDGIPDAK